jgi:3-oxoacyl-[acyl-carrier protein] reductase
MDLDLRGKIALVTGGTSGIGRAIAAALLDEGCEVHAADVNLAAAHGTPEFDAANAHLLCMDVGDAKGVQQAVDAIVAERGRIDILVNCAGILKTRSLVESTIADWDDVARVNLSGVYYCSKAVLPTMIARRYGKIINIASVSSAKGGGQFGNVLYGSTKAGVVAMTQGFARELGPYGINVNAISPGVVEGTPMTSGLMTPDVRQRIVDSIPLRRLIEPAEIARLALYLASDISSGMTGQAVVLDAGFLVR